MTQREMTLEEVVNTLPQGHKARKEYEQLKLSDGKLSALEEMGVDNWSGYSDAMHYFKTGEIPA